MARQNITLSSSAIPNVAYDDETEEMFITFKDGKSYTLQGVPEIEFYRLTNSDSPGGYWNANMRGKY